MLPRDEEIVEHQIACRVAPDDQLADDRHRAGGLRGGSVDDQVDDRSLHRVAEAKTRSVAHSNLGNRPVFEKGAVCGRIDGEPPACVTDGEVETRHRGMIHDEVALG